MADYNYQATHLPLVPALPQSQTPGDHNPWRAEAHLEAHLVQRQQLALAAIQDLERQRLQPKLSQDLAASQPL